MKKRKLTQVVLRKIIKEEKAKLLKEWDKENPYDDIDFELRHPNTGMQKGLNFAKQQIETTCGNLHAEIERRYSHYEDDIVSGYVKEMIEQWVDEYFR